MSVDELKKQTPMMERYLEVKRQNPGSLLLFRMGDFYELFFDDAQLAAKVLGLTLTSRDKGSPNPVPMAGFPYHALENYLQKLIHSGLRVAICDQVEDPKFAKGLVRREVTRIVTPGTLVDEGLLDPKKCNFLASLWPEKHAIGLAWLELSTGRFVAAQIEPQCLADELARIEPAECLVPEQVLPPAILAVLAEREGMLTSQRPAWSFARADCRRLLLEHFGTTTFDGFDLDENSPGVTAAGALLQYVQETQKSALAHIVRLEPYRRGSSLLIDESTRRSLELTETLRTGTRDGSLLSVIDETVTPMGARVLTEWLANPLTDGAAINERLDAVEELTQDVVLTRDVRDELERAYDLERLTARVATGRAGPRDLACLARTLSLLPKLKARLSARRSRRLAQLEEQLDLCADVRSEIERALADEPPLGTTEGNIFRAGYNPQLDELRGLARGGKEWIARYQAEEIARTGISNLKVGFNRVFGYYLEVTASQAAKVPAEYMRKQTLKNQERYITPPLKEHEEKVLRAEEQAIALEQELFAALRDRVAGQSRRLTSTAAALAEIDVLAALATVAVRHNYCRPELCAEPILDVRDGRHPVLDRLKPSGEFVPNDTRLGVAESEPEDGSEAALAGRVQIITGPNMAGKSTFIRQAALITILAQMGSFVPARSARIGIADRIFARVGASDELGKGQSTFMVEMAETARILNAATSRSLVILDEIGRGTSTYDGISLAWAVTEHLHDVVGCRTLFATHYHELTELTQTLSAASNWNVAVREDADDVIFLHQIVPGTADKSYGIHVARLAGVPREVVERARVILESLEADHVDEAGRPKVPARTTRPAARKQLTLFQPDNHPVLDAIRELDLDRMTPLAALEKLHALRQGLASNAESGKPAL
ncbi:MAG TPA: DNA mismatch repair protein MutS [Planctomycetaceae bacterium]|nr:DNA mismatch repair protein MutS [Planctomycetaceae bacterium]